MTVRTLTATFLRFAALDIPRPVARGSVDVHRVATSRLRADPAAAQEYSRRRTISHQAPVDIARANSAFQRRFLHQRNGAGL